MTDWSYREQVEREDREYELRIAAAEALDKIEGREKYSFGSMDALAFFLGAPDYHDVKANHEKYHDLMVALTGPHSYAVYKAVKAKRSFR